MEENKKCCEGENKEGCCMTQGYCNWKKCHMIKHLFWIILVVVAFCLGTQLGELKSEARGGYHFNRGNMMDWKYKNVTPLTGNELPGTPATPESPVTQ